MNKGERFIYPFLVFLSGASVLIIEVVAVRILSPYFGNTIFTYSSVLSIILAALSFGYYFGGRLADKNPKESLFFNLFILSGLFTAVFYIVGKLLLPLFSGKLSISAGPLIFSLIIFFVPAFIMGMLSPFAIKLHQAKNKDLGVGSVSGEIFFWSTLGSISGSLLTGYVFLPRFGTDAIFLAVSVLLTALGIIFKLKNTTNLLYLIYLLVFFVSVNKLFALFDAPKYNSTLYASEGFYEHIEVIEIPISGRAGRLLLQDLNHSAAMYLDSDELVFDYTKYYSLYRPFNDAKKVLVLGAGAYSIPKAYEEELPDAQIDVIDIEPKLQRISSDYFRLGEYSNINTHIEDARRFLVTSEEKYDVIYADVYHSMMSVPSHLTTVEFFEVVQDRLSDDGVFIANIIGSLEKKHPSFTLSEMRTWKETFDNSIFFATEEINSETPQNLIYFASKKEIDQENLNSDTLGIASIEERIINTDYFDLDSHFLLTDNYAPVDFLTAQEFKNFRIRGY